MAVPIQMDIFIAAQASVKFARDITAVLSQEDVHLQAVYAFEALGTLLHAPSLTIETAILVLGGGEDVRVAELMAFLGWRKCDIFAYLRKSSGCVQSFLLLAALKGVLYDEAQVSELMCQMLVSSGLAAKFPVAAKQLEKLLKVLEPKTKPFLQDIANSSLRIVSIASAIPKSEVDGLQSASLQLRPSTMGDVLVHAFETLRCEPKNGDVVELRGSTGIFDVATIILWLAPERTSICLTQTQSERHPMNREIQFGSAENCLLIQCGPGSVDYDSKGNLFPGWRKVPWSSPKTMALDALGWASIVRPLVGGKGGMIGDVAINIAKKWLV